MLRMVADNVALVRRARRRARRRRRPRLGRADRLELGAAAARRVPRRRRAVRAVRPGRRRAPVRRLPGDGWRRGVLHRVLPAAGAGRGGDRAGRAPVAARVLLVGVRRRRAAAGRQRDDGDRAPRRSAGRPLHLPRRDAGVAERARTSTSTPASSSAPGSPAGSTATATSTATGTTCRRSAAGRSRCRRCSSVATATARRSGAPAPSSASATTLPRLHRSVILDGCGHWTQQERPDDVNEALARFPLRGRVKDPLVDFSGP